MRQINAGSGSPMREKCFMAAAATTTPLATRTAGVSGEFHSQGNLLLAARTARRRGFAADRMWFIGEPTEDALGGPMGFVLPVSFVRELTLALAVLGGLLGLLLASTLQWRGWGEALRQAPVGLLAGAVVGAAIGLGSGWAALSARVGAYLARAHAGTLRLKIGLPAGLPAAEAERLAEVAERVLREAKAESVRRADGTVDYNSPQNPAYVA